MPNHYFSVLLEDLYFLQYLLELFLYFGCQLQIWDTAGEERYRQGGLTSSFYRGAHGALIVFSLTSHKSFENVKKLWIDEFYRKRYFMIITNNLGLALSKAHGCPPCMDNDFIVICFH